MQTILSILHVLVLAWAIPFTHYGQALPTSSPCACDGGYSFTTALPAPLSYSLSDSNGALVVSGVSLTATITFTNLCTSAYILNVISDTTEVVIAINVPSVGLQPGTAVTDSICDNSPPVSLGSLLTNELPGGSWTTPAGAAHSGTYTPTLDLPGLYVYTLPSAGCSVSTGVYMHEIQNANPGLSSTRAICSNFLPLALFDQLNGTPDMGGEWLNASGNLFNGIYDPATMDPATFIYRINTVPGCSPVFATVTIQEDQIPNAGQNSDVLVCSGATPFSMFNYLEGSPQAGGIWLNAMAMPVDGTFDPATDPYGVYRYVVNSSALCPSASSFLTINFTSTNPSGLANSVSLCINGAPLSMISALNGNPLPGGQWRNAQNILVDDVFQPSTESAGVYSYFYPNVGCSPSTGNLTIQVEALPQAGPDGLAHLCSNTSQVNLFSVLQPTVVGTGTWLFNGSPVNPSVIPGGSSTLSYTYQVSGVICPPDVSIHTLVFDPITADPPDQTLTLCSSDPAQDLNTLYPGFTGLLFSSSTGQSISSLIQPATTSSQVVTVVNPSQNACPASSGSIVISVDQPSFLSQSITIDVCESQGSLFLESLAPTLDFTTGAWFDGLGNEISPTVLVSGNASTSYFFRTGNSSQCGLSELEIVMNSYSLPFAGIGGNFTYCISDAPVLWTTMIPANAPLVGSWTLDSAPITDVFFDPSVYSSGSYVYTLPSNGPCLASSATVFIEVDPGFPLNAGGDVAICSGANSFSIGSTGETGVEYSWTPAIGLSSTSVADPLFTAINSTSAAIQQIYEVTGTNGSCTYTDQVQITIYPELSESMPDELAVCLGETITLSSVYDGDYLWTPTLFFSNSTAAEQTFVPEEDMILGYSITSPFGCSINETISIQVNPLPSPVLALLPAAQCPPLLASFSLDASSTGAASIAWTLEGPEIYSGEGAAWTTTLNDAGFYNLSLTAESAEGCVTTIFLTDALEVYPSPSASFEWQPLIPTTADNEVQFENTSVDYTTAYWSVGSFGEVEVDHLNWVFNENEPGQYAVCLRVQNEFGCADTVCRSIDVENTFLFYMPNAFTPDDDGLNEQFKPQLLGFEETEYEFLIFNRWGEQLFRTESIEEGWSGDVRNGGYYGQNDVYVWQVRARVKRSLDFKEYRGYVTLIR
jgi:gliding motility-associated-like protein